MLAEQALFNILDEKIRTDKLILPTLPDIALQVRQMSADPAVSLHDMAGIISQDPALAARMIKVANSAFLGRSIKVTTLNQAVTRIGLSQIKNIATAMAIEQLFVSKNRLIQKWLGKVWSNSTRCAATAVACLHFYNTKHEQTGLNTDVMALSALIYNIGALPVLSELERQQDLLGNPVFLAGLIDKVAARIGEKIVQAWGFTEEFRQVVTGWRDLRPEKNGVSYTDFIRLSAISDGYYTDKAAQQRLLNYYVAAQLVPVPVFMKQAEIVNVYQDIRAVFH
ncbi:HDOD domain-containing protein [Chromatiaceae bacterium AAb-1]|nr:HDOD domain-containing protein [Chromatiaceae bacterium AAb-1]